MPESHKTSTAGLTTSRIKSQHRQVVEGGMRGEVGEVAEEEEKRLQLAALAAILAGSAL
jgi:hypothetical protein